MVKRKAAATEVAAEIEAQFPIKKKKVSVSSTDENGKLDCKLPTTLMESLLGDTKLDDFVNTYWEKKPLVVNRKESGFYGEILALDTLKEVIKNNELEYETDMNVCRVVNNEKEILNEDGVIKVEDVEKFLKEEKATIQFHHPQRYVDGLWNVVEKLETYFGCLVGSCVYVTPANSQGVLPHCDDVDTFHLQLEGSQQWKLYKPMVELSRDYTQDLPAESIGEPILEVTLEAGDFLYFPRGVIYQSKNESSDTHSTHISISTYQQNTWGDFMNHAVQQAIENALENDVSIRSGLPINYLSMLGTAKDMNSYVVMEDEADEKDDEKKYSNLHDPKVIEFKETVKAQLSKLVDHIDVNTASDAMCTDFFSSRLPPYGHVKKDVSEDEVLPGIENKIKIKYPEHVRIVYDDEEEGDGDHDEDDDDESDEDVEMEDEKPANTKSPEAKPSKSTGSKSPKKSSKKSANGEEDDEDDDDEDADVDDIQPHVKILHTLDNDRFTHMGGGIYDSENGCIRLHVSFAKAAVELLNNCDRFTDVKDILIEEDEDKVTLATLLFQHGLIEVQS